MCSSLEYPVGINREGVRNGVDAKHPCYWTSEGTVAVLRPGHFVLHDEVFPFLLFRIQAHAGGLRRLSLKLFCQPFGYAAAPRGKARTT